MPTEQSFANHRRIDPHYHLVAMPIALLAALGGVAHATMTILDGAGARDSLGGIAIALCGVGLVLLAVRVRAYGLRVQDRVIQIEVALRYREIAGESFGPLAARLTRSQIVALRFAGDEELAPLAARAAEERLSPTAIKQAIRHWRADLSRV